MRRFILPVCLIALLLVGCGSIRTIPTTTQENSTVSILAGWMQDVTRDNISITITDSASTVTTYPPGDIRIRALTNLYPDPVSSLVVDARTNAVGNYAATINDNQTNQDNDWWDTLVVFDLPATMAVGPATVVIDGPSSSYGPVDLEIIPGTGTPDPLQANFAFGPVTMVRAFTGPLDRPDHYTVMFDTTGTIPHAIEVNFSHDPDKTITMVETDPRALAINPRGEIKSLVWEDDGINMKVIMLRSNDLVVTHIKDFKFYVAGGITNLSLDSFTAYDENGVEIPGITADCTGCI